jgi:hypothetical protein
LVVRNLHALIGSERLLGRIVAEGFEVFQFDVRVATIQGVGAGHLALG